MTTSETCDYCRKAAIRADFPLYRSQCRGCAVRSLAASPLFHGAALSGRLGDPYAKALGLIFGDDWRAGHDLVKAEAKRIREAKAIL